MKFLSYVADLDWNTVRRNFGLVEDLFSTASKDDDGFGFKVFGITVRFGTVTLAWTAGQNLSATASVTHGLGTTPVVAFACPIQAALPSIGVAQAFSLGGSSFTVQGYSFTAPPGNTNVTTGWVAIG